MFKKEIRVLGIDDSPFSKTSSEKNLVFGVVYRGGECLDGVMSCEVEVDGVDATQQILSMIKKSKYRNHLKCIFTDGVAVAGFNIIDLKELHKKTKIPIITIMRKKPNLKKMKDALKHIQQEEKIAVLEKAGPIQNTNNLYVQLHGMSTSQAKELLDLTCTRSFLPEPLRVAHLMAAGIAKGESSGKA